MKSGNWKDSAELIGIAAIVASLVFVGIQLRQEQRIALVEIGQNSTAINTDIEIAISNIADTWVKSNAGEALSKAESLAIERIAMASYRMTVTSSLERRRLGSDQSVSVPFFAIWLYENPGARQLWERRMEKDWNLFKLIGPTTTVLDVYNEVLANLDKLDNLNGSQTM